MVSEYSPGTSNHIAKVRYDNDREQLQVVFKDSSTATYGQVPAHVYTQMQTFHSVGTYYHRVIKVHYPQLSRTYPSGLVENRSRHAQKESQ